MADITPSYKLKIDGGGDVNTPVLQLAVDANKYLTLDGKSLIDLIYPVGILINMSSSEASRAFPGTEWKGFGTLLERRLCNIPKTRMYQGSASFDSVTVDKSVLESILGVTSAADIYAKLNGVTSVCINGDSYGQFVYKRVKSWAIYNIVTTYVYTIAFDSNFSPANFPNSDITSVELYETLNDPCCYRTK